MKEQLTLSIERETKKQVEKRAKAEGRSISVIIEELLNSVYLPTEKDIEQEQQIAEAGFDDWAENLE